MLNRLLASVLLALITLVAAPMAHAEDIPVLTWEKGKEHNIVLGGNGDVKNWNISLVSEDAEPLAFRQSKIDPKGYVVFSVQIPDSYPTGVYTVQTVGETAPKKIVAGVKIVDISSFNLIQIPTKLMAILITLILLISTLSIMRMQKYERIEYLRAKPVQRIPGVFNLLYRFRTAAVDELHSSLFKFQLVREGELLLKLSPIAWSVLPIISVLLGGYVGLNGTLILGVSFIPLFVYTLVAIVGVIDPFSGFMAAIGFAFTQSVTGNVTSVRSVMSLVAVAIGWIAPGVLSSLYQDILRKDSYFKFVQKILPELAASVFGGLVFLVAQLLTNSFVDQVAPIAVSSFLIPGIVSVVVFVRIHLYRYLVKDLHQTGENYQIRIMVLPRVLSPRTITFAALYFAGTIYVWTGSVQFALISSALLSTPLALLMVRFEGPVIKSFVKSERYIFIEIVVVSTLAFICFFYIQSLPIEVTAKGKFFILTTSLLLFIHGFISSVLDSSARSAEAKVPVNEKEMAL